MINKETLDYYLNKQGTTWKKTLLIIKKHLELLIHILRTLLRLRFIKLNSFKSVKQKRFNYFDER